MSGQPIRVTFGTILSAIQAQLVNITGFETTAVKLIGRKDGLVPHLMGDRDILVRPSGFVVPVDQEEASGRIATRLDRTVYIFPRVRMGRDEVDRDTQWLIDPENGIFALEETVLDALLDWLPTDQDGNELTSRGLWLTRGTEAEKELAGDRSKPTLMSNWGHSCLAFSAYYLPNINVGTYGIVG